MASNIGFFCDSLLFHHPQKIDVLKVTRHAHRPTGKPDMHASPPPLPPKVPFKSLSSLNRCFPPLFWPLSELMISATVWFSRGGHLPANQGFMVLWIPPPSVLDSDPLQHFSLFWFDARCWQWPPPIWTP